MHERRTDVSRSALLWRDASDNDTCPNLGSVLDAGDSHYQVLCGDNRIALPHVPPLSVDLVITSPPYFGQREYSSLGLGNEDTTTEYLDNIMEAFNQVVNIVKPTGSIVYNMGDKIAAGSLQLVPYRFAARVLDECKLRLVNDITWVKRNPTPHQFSRRLTRSTEPFFHFAVSKDYYYHREAFQPSPSTPRRKPSPKLGSRYRSLLKQSGLTKSERQAANEALDEVIEEVSEGKIHSFRMKIRGIHAPAYGGQDGGRKMHIERDGFTIIRISGHKIKRDVIESPVESLPGNGHPAIFPVSVVRELIRLLCPKDGLVLDPYLGSGSTMVAAALEGRNCIGIDISSEYCDSAKSRVLSEIQKRVHE